MQAFASYTLTLLAVCMRVGNECWLVRTSAGSCYHMLAYAGKFSKKTNHIHSKRVTFKKHLYTSLELNNDNSVAYTHSQHTTHASIC